MTSLFVKVLAVTVTVAVAKMAPPYSASLFVKVLSVTVTVVA